VSTLVGWGILGYDRAKLATAIQLRDEIDVERVTRMTDSPSDRALYDRVVEFVRSETRTRRQLSSNTDVAKDLGVDGDDARDFMLRFQREFDVDLSHFNFDRHFGGEGFRLTAAIMSAVGKGNVRAPVTISVLLDAATARRWPAGE
jgi:hypothetical protein